LQERWGEHPHPPSASFENVVQNYLQSPPSFAAPHTESPDTQNGYCPSVLLFMPAPPPTVRPGPGRDDQSPRVAKVLPSVRERRVHLPHHTLLVQGAGLRRGRHGYGKGVVMSTPPLCAHTCSLVRSLVVSSPEESVFVRILSNSGSGSVCAGGHSKIFRRIDSGETETNTWVVERNRLEASLGPRPSQ